MQVYLLSVQRQLMVVDVQLGCQSFALSKPDVQVLYLRGNGGGNYR